MQWITLRSEALYISSSLAFSHRFVDHLNLRSRSALRTSAHRYVYSLIARAIVRGADPDWIKQVYSFSLKPDAVFYLRIDVAQLVPRVVMNGGLDLLGAGVDLPVGDHLHQDVSSCQAQCLDGQGCLW